MERELTEDERRFKEWLTQLLPAELGRIDVAREFGVSRRTISNLLSPNSPHWANGYTTLRYLRFVGALKDAPDESPGASRLAQIEEITRLTLAITEQAVRGALPQIVPGERDLEQAARLVDLLQKARELLDDGPEEMTP